MHRKLVFSRNPLVGSHAHVPIFRNGHERVCPWRGTHTIHYRYVDDRLIFPENGMVVLLRGNISRPICRKCGREKRGRTEKACILLIFIVNRALQFGVRVCISHVEPVRREGPVCIAIEPHPLVVIRPEVEHQALDRATAVGVAGYHVSKCSKIPRCGDGEDMRRRLPR